jgi:4-diphosphocytidyl-2-C-methyl-D-erythritol kinase
MLLSMLATVRSFAKINIGLCIGRLRPDGFHELRTVYQTIALHDLVRVEVKRGTGIEILCSDARVPRDDSNTCFRIVDKAMSALKARGHVIVGIEKRLPVRGGLGGASSNAVAALLALERVLEKKLPGPEKLRLAADVGSDLPLSLIGGTVLGVSRGEEVYPLPDLPSMACVIAVPEIAVSTPQAFKDWDAMIEQPDRPVTSTVAAKLTLSHGSDRITEFGRAVSTWLSSEYEAKIKRLSGVPAGGRGQAGNPLLKLVRTGIENDFERVVFPQYPELRELKRVLERAGAAYASLSGSGSAIYGLFSSKRKAEHARERFRQRGTAAVVTTTLTRQQYWKRVWQSGIEDFRLKISD